MNGYGIKATFFVSLGLLGSRSEVGVIASEENLIRASEEGNELGCHTFDHIYAWQSTPDRFIASVQKNKLALDKILPGAVFRTFAYPTGEPKPSIKGKLGDHFLCCRGGGQAPNVKTADLNLLKAYFLDKRNNNNINLLKQVIEYNAISRGWLIFATHDLSENPSPYGCTPDFFEQVVKCAIQSGAIILTVREAYNTLWPAESDETYYNSSRFDGFALQ